MWGALSDELQRVDHRVPTLSLHRPLPGVPAGATALVIWAPCSSVHRAGAQTRFGGGIRNLTQCLEPGWAEICALIFGTLKK